MKMGGISLGAKQKSSCSPWILLWVEFGRICTWVKRDVLHCSQHNGFQNYRCCICQRWEHCNRSLLFLYRGRVGANSTEPLNKGEFIHAYSWIKANIVLVPVSQMQLRHMHSHMPQLVQSHWVLLKLSYNKFYSFFVCDLYLCLT